MSSGKTKLNLKKVTRQDENSTGGMTQGKSDQVENSPIDFTEAVQSNEAIQNYQGRFHNIINNLPGLVYRCRPDSGGTAEFISNGCKELTGYEPSEIIGNRKISLAQLIHPDDIDRIKKELVVALKEKRPYTLTCRLTTASNKEKWVSIRGYTVYDKQEKPEALEGYISDISRRKNLENTISSTHEKLIIEQVALRTKNVTLREVLRQIETEKIQIKSRIQTNVHRIIKPILDTLKKKSDKLQATYLELLENALTDITSPFINRLEIQCTRLSPRELEICNMIKNGFSTKDIASTLDLSIHTVLKQRQCIRKKLGIYNTDINLFTRLQSLQSDSMKKYHTVAE